MNEHIHFLPEANAVLISEIIEANRRGHIDWEQRIQLIELAEWDEPKARAQLKEMRREG